MKRAAVAIIKNEKDETLFLLREKQPNGLCFPGGKLDEGETSRQACIREVFEETGITLVEEQVILIGERVSSTGIPVTLYSIQLEYTPIIKLSKNEHSLYKWLMLTDSDIMTYKFAGNTLNWLGISPTVS